MGTQRIFLAHDDGVTFEAGHLGGAGIQHDHLGVVALQCPFDFVPPDGIADHIGGLLSRCLEDHAHNIAERLCQFGDGIEGIGAVLTARLVELHSAELGVTVEDAHIAEALGNRVMQSTPDIPCNHLLKLTRTEVAATGVSHDLQPHRPGA
ncbi:MAG: hypothetical protein L0I29_19760 [Hyphomicrobiales bacterium]|nr:hypothetical protein [Hyphomicrobiales bacterium]